MWGFGCDFVWVGEWLRTPTVLWEVSRIRHIEYANNAHFFGPQYGVWELLLLAQKMWVLDLRLALFPTWSRALSLVMGRKGGRGAG